MDHLQTKIENEDDEDANENDNSKKNEGGGEACEEKKVIEDARFLYNPTFSFNRSNAKRDHHVIEIEKEKNEDLNTASISYEVLNNRNDGKMLKDAINFLDFRSLEIDENDKKEKPTGLDQLEKNTPMRKNSSKLGFDTLYDFHEEINTKSEVNDRYKTKYISECGQPIRRETKEGLCTGNKQTGIDNKGKDGRNGEIKEIKNDETDTIVYYTHSTEDDKPNRNRKRNVSDSFEMLRRNSFLEKHPYLKTNSNEIQGANNIKSNQNVEEEKLNMKLNDLLIEWHSFCDNQSALHGLSSSHYRLIGNTISVLAILLATVGGTTNLATMEKHDATTAIVFGVLSLTSGALMSIHRTLNFPELQRSHNFHSDQYAKIKNEIEMQLNIHQCMNKTYSNLVEFCKSIKNQIDSLIDRSPFIQAYIIRNYFKEKEESKKDRSVMYSSILLMNQKRPEIGKCVK